MVSRRLLEPVRGLANAGAKPKHVGQSFMIRSMATTTDTTTFKTTLPPFPEQTIEQPLPDITLTSSNTPTPMKPILQDTTPTTTTPSLYKSKLYKPPPNPFIAPVLTILHSFPSFEPVDHTTYPHSALMLPLRRDILHRAIIYEGDATRQGTASTKWRSEVHGSNAKVRPQKGSGKARLGDKKSPMLKGGGVAFGPKPRDFSTGLPRKLYDLAWRTALSYRYRRGQLTVVRGSMEIEKSGPGSARWMKDLLAWHGWGRADGKTTFITEEKRENLKAALENPAVPREAKVLTVEEVDVKDLLEMGRVVIEKGALDAVLGEHSSDLYVRWSKRPLKE